MRIVDRETFLKMPAGTIAAKFGDKDGGGFFFSDVFVKWATCGNDFVRQDLDAQFEGWTGSESHFDELDRMVNDPSHESPPLDYDSAGRDGLFDEKQLFAVWSKQDAANLMDLLSKAMIAAFPTSTPSASDGECNRSDSKESA